MGTALRVWAVLVDLYAAMTDEWASAAPRSPRALEACKRLGYEPSELVYRPVQDFRESGVEQWQVQMRHDHVEHKRQEKIKAVQRERKQIDRSPNGGRSRGTADMSFLDDANASSVKREQMQMEKLKRRQTQEFEQLLQHEMKQVEMQEQMQEKERLEKMRHEAHLAEVARRKKEFERKKKEMEEK